MTHHAGVLDAIERTLGVRPASVTPLAGGCIAEVWRAQMPDGRSLAVKHDPGPTPKLDIESAMLAAIRERTAMPVPKVVASTPAVLAMAYVEHDGRKSAEGERDAGAQLARMHEDARADRFGFERDTVIGPLDQPNPWTGSWADFWRDQRLIPMGEGARRAGGLDGRTLDRVRALGDRLGDLLGGVPGEGGEPSLIHGDLWSGNWLWHRGRLAAVIDPAVYYAHAEAELAFIDWMGGMSGAFWEGYSGVRPIDDAFWSVRRHVYVLYPMLVHARLFGGGYGRSVSATLDRLGV
ncbi:MAG: fructosamine kinase family protein [Phycisphaerales bacterium]